MGTVFKPIVTRPLPSGAEVTTDREGARTAKWRNSQGKLCTAPVRTTPRGACVEIEVTKYYARYRDGTGVVRTVATGVKDLAAARAVLFQLEQRAEKVRAGILTPAEDATSAHKRSQIGVHVEAYVASLVAKRRVPRHCDTVRRLVTGVIEGCGFRTLADIRCEPVETWLDGPDNGSRSLRTRNSYLEAMKWFCNWCVATERLVSNPIARIAAADDKLDPRRIPRALTPDELTRLLDAALRRPLDEAMRFNKGWRKGQEGTRLRPETRAKLERLGIERATAYKTLALTGLRLGELAAIRVCDVVLDGPAPHIILESRHEKNRKGSTLPLRADLAGDLRAWLTMHPGLPDRLLFRLSANQVKVFDRDLRFAGIAKRDDRNMTACIHSLRHSFGTLLSRGGVAPRVAQAAMRHSTIELTMGVYTDPRLLDVAGALDVLPSLPLGFRTGEVATGT